MSYTIAGVFRPDLGSSADDLDVAGYPVSSWSGAAPSLGTTPPADPPATATTGTNFGNHGAWELALSTNEDYFVVVTYDADYYWQRCNVPAWTDGTQSELDVTTEDASGQVNADSVFINGIQAFGLDPDPFGAVVTTIGTTSTGSTSGGSVAEGAFVDHQHAGLGQSLGLPPGDVATRYAGATTSGSPSSGSYDPGDFVIDQTGVLWIYTSDNEWVPIGGNTVSASGDIKAFAGIVVPGGWLACDGSAYSRTDADYVALCAAISTSQFTGADAFVGTTTSSSTDVTDIPTAVTDVLQPGWPISGGPIASGTVIDSVSSGAITLSQAATATASGASLFAAPWGVGDGSTTFNVPDLRGRVAVGTSAGATALSSSASTTSGSTTMTGLTSSVVSRLAPGMVIGGPGLSASTTVVAVLSTTEIEMSATPETAESDQTFTFTAVLGTQSGEGMHMDSSTELAGHSHTIVDPGHGHGINDPSHNHQEIFGNSSGSWLVAQNVQNMDQSFGTMLTNVNWTGITIVDNYTGISMEDAGNGVGHNTMQPYGTVAYVIKL